MSRRLRQDQIDSLGSAMVNALAKACKDFDIDSESVHVDIRVAAQGGPTLIDINVVDEIVEEVYGGED